MSRRNILDGASLSAFEQVKGSSAIEEGVHKSTEGQIVELPLNELHEFKNHPFRVIDDEKMAETVDSIKEYGVLVPGIARPRPEGGYEILAGHRRRHASELAGKETMPMIIKDVSDDEAVLIMVDSNIQREELLPSEKAKAYSMKYEALKHQGVNGGRSLDKMAKEAREGAKTVQRYISLSKLVEELMKLVDDGKLGIVQGVDFSQLTEEEQKILYVVLSDMKCSVSTEQSGKIKEIAKAGKFTRESVLGVLVVVKPKVRKVTFNAKKLDSYFDSTMTNEDIEELIIRLLDEWKERGGVD
ncbi:ParB/RepB/Spo0J family partition protein [Eubacterium oxidoreducens]|uniref:Chromosome partitioning protein, ParB family n=1 Tax=Eubacterium oxidoreducens TaxID=1732 RepID=A0A1G6A085_EUBOX|nr:ParB/RepB/Spo0J family partition protein [Eubacterium oxidoreducens]SDB01854.1 chromosome partitioning protein, ParB family [Eubacterium oxidoreducens]